MLAKMNNISKCAKFRCYPYKTVWYNDASISKPKLKIGDKVRISKASSIFDKSIFQIGQKNYLPYQK